MEMPAISLAFSAFINDLEKLQILKEVTGGQRGRAYVFEDYLNLFRK